MSLRSIRTDVLDAFRSATPDAGVASWRYDHEGSAQVPMRRRLIGLALVAMGVLILAIAGSVAVIVLAVVALGALLALRRAPRKLLMTPRYLLCGDTLVYFGNVTSLERNDPAGSLRLVSPDGQGFTLERARFTSNARKDHKIAANKAAKFTRVADRIVEQVLAASPSVQTRGISRGATPAKKASR